MARYWIPGTGVFIITSSLISYMILVSGTVTFTTTTMYSEYHILLRAMSSVALVPTNSWSARVQSVLPREQSTGGRNTSESSRDVVGVLQVEYT